MSASQRRKTFNRAYARGEDAFWKSNSRDSNPYKFSEWGNGHAWQLGWDRAKASAEEGVRHGIYGNPLDKQVMGDSDDI